jgi:hypothetical protein
MSATLTTLATQAAVKAVKRELQSRGLKVVHIERAIIVAAADRYLKQHPELLEQAAETVPKVPQLRTLYEREMRRRRRNQR